MTTPVSLASEQATRALEILQQESLALRPSPRQVLVYRVLHWDVAAFGVALVAVWLTTVIHPDRSALTDVVAGLLGLTGLVMFPLFLLNLGLVRRLWRVARVRCRLGLTQPLAAIFRAQRQKNRLRNLATALLVLVGMGFVLLAVMVAMVAENLGGPLVAAFLVAFWLALAVPLLSLHFLRRGMERLAVVDRLRSGLSAAVSDAGAGEAKSIAVSAKDYELIAGIERAQIIAERYQNIRRSQGSTKGSGFAVQMGIAAQQAKSELPGRERVLIDEQILRLMEDPQPTGVIIDAEGALRRLPVPGTSAEIVFDLDQAARRVRIVRIVSPAVPQSAIRG